MFKNIMLIMLATILALTFASCSGQEEPEQPAEGIDIDLTVMSSTMVYSQVYDMMLNPTEYDGKSIKLEGTFYSEYYELTNTTYNFVIINDATGCCPQGLEFAPIEEGTELPEQGAMIEMTGTFDKYDEGNNSYYRINADSITV